MAIDKLIEKLLDLDNVTESGTITFSAETKELIHKIAEICNDLPIVQETKQLTEQYAEGLTAQEIYADMLHKIVKAPTSVHMKMVPRMLIPVIDQKLAEEGD